MDLVRHLRACEVVHGVLFYVHVLFRLLFWVEFLYVVVYVCFFLGDDVCDGVVVDFFCVCVGCGCLVVGVCGVWLCYCMERGVLEVFVF